jgi:hypothetical protein
MKLRDFLQVHFAAAKSCCRAAQLPRASFFEEQSIQRKKFVQPAAMSSVDAM